MNTPIRDSEGNTVGYQDTDGSLRDSHSKKIGHITREGVVYDSHREQVGTVNERGDVIDRYGRQVGSISSDGTVQDWHGIPVYNGSAAPLLLDFEKTARETERTNRIDFDRMARDAKSPQTERPPTRILPEGFVSPSVIGCLGIIAAVLLGFGIFYVFQNPSFLARGKATPTLSALVTGTPSAGSSDTTPVPNAAPQVTKTPQQATGKVNTTILNLRQGPATSFEVVDRLQQDDIVVIGGRLSDNSWLKVTVPSIGKEGWVATQYVDLNVDVGTLPVVQPPSQ